MKTITGNHRLNLTMFRQKVYQTLFLYKETWHLDIQPPYMKRIMGSLPQMSFLDHGLPGEGRMMDPSSGFAWRTAQNSSQPKRENQFKRPNKLKLELKDR